MQLVSMKSALRQYKVLTFDRFRRELSHFRAQLGAELFRNNNLWATRQLQNFPARLKRIPHHTGIFSSMLLQSTFQSQLICLHPQEPRHNVHLQHTVITSSSHFRHAQTLVNPLTKIQKHARHALVHTTKQLYALYLFKMYCAAGRFNGSLVISTLTPPFFPSVYCTYTCGAIFNLPSYLFS